MAPAFDSESSCRSKENDSVFSSILSSAISTLKHSLRGPAVGDPGLLGITLTTEVNAVSLVKSLPASKHYIIIIIVNII